MDVPASEDGTVEELLVKLGDKVSEGTPDPAAQDGAGGVARTPPPRSRPAGAARQAAGAPPRRRGPAHPRPAAAPRRREPSFAGVHASPSVRRLARELEVDLDQAQGHRRERPDHQGGREGVPQGPGAGTGGGRRHPRADGHPRDPGRGLRQVRPGRDQAARPDQADLGPASAPRLAQHPARHPWRRGRHHRDRGLPQGARHRGQGEGLPGDAAGLPDEGQRLGAQGVPGVQQLARRRRRTA